MSLSLKLIEEQQHERERGCDACVGQTKVVKKENIGRIRKHRGPMSYQRRSKDRNVMPILDTAVYVPVCQEHVRLQCSRRVSNRVLVIADNKFTACLSSREVNNDGESWDEKLSCGFI